MLTFFRKIRKSLLGNGSAPRYIMYAVGEIALVVIGILIALQINNWNEDRIIAREIDNSLLKVKKDLENDFEIFGRQDSIFGTMISKAKHIQQLLLNENDMSEVSELRSLRLAPRNFDYFSFAFESTVNTGILYKIEDDELVYEISDYYRNMDDQTEIMSRHNASLRGHKTGEAMDPFNFITLIGENMVPSRSISLHWLNDYDSRYFQASQVYLAQYIALFSYNQQRMKDFQVLNRRLDQMIDNFIQNRKS